MSRYRLQLPEQSLVLKPVGHATYSAFGVRRQTQCFGSLRNRSNWRVGMHSMSPTKLVVLLTRVRRSLRRLRTLFPSGG